MNLEKIIFGFFIVLALTLNVSFVVGDIDNPAHHDVIMLFLAIIVNLVATGLKLGDRSQIGALLLATSLVADLQLLAAALVWAIAVHVSTSGLDAGSLVTIVSLAGGAVVANVVSVAMVVVETLMSRR